MKHHAAAKLQTYLTLREESGHATLQVEALATTSFGALIKGSYHVVYADTWCLILRPSNPKGSKVCTVWVPATTAAFKHTACRSAFKAIRKRSDITSPRGAAPTSLSSSVVLRAFARGTENLIVPDKAASNLRSRDIFHILTQQS
ncbi:hypothetical protein V5799_018623 [Amblyomma americanum]|uniref:Uncharacterized protein n=1 Tax=Amblyomma americanum TaxID=6943 RepID=A0AAQ4EYW9_AMBAM